MNSPMEPPPEPEGKLEALRKLLSSMPDASLRTALDEMSVQDPVLWTMLHRRINGQGFVFDNRKRLDSETLRKLKHEMPKLKYQQELKSRLLRHRPFLEQPLRDQHPHKAYMKGRQVGVSELSFTEVVWFLSTHPGTKYLYTFPRDRQLQDFVNSRMNKAFMETPRMRALLGSPNQVYMKKIRDSYLILRSAWESNLGEGVDADGVTLDERDRMRKGVEIAFKESLSASKWGLLREVSTPTFPGKGIHESYNRSDQQQWFVRCEKCSLEQTIDFPDNFIQVAEVKRGVTELPEGSYEFLCRLERCRGKLDRLRGRWVAAKPNNKNVRGYHMPQSIAPWLTATELMQAKMDDHSNQLFMNYTMGLPSMGDNILLTEEDYEMACAGHDLMTHRTSDWRDICVGIDWGHYNWVVVTARNVHNDRVYVIGIRVFEDDYAHELSSVKGVEAYIAPFRPDIILADAGYGKDRNAYLLRKFGEGRFYSAWYNPAPKSSRTFVPQWSTPEMARVLVDRTMTLKETCRAIKEKDIGFPSYEIHEAMLLKQHFQNLSPVKEEDDDGQIIETIDAKGDDHLVHATALSLVGLEQLTKTMHFDFAFA